MRHRKNSAGIEIMFVKDYVDTNTFDQPVYIEATTRGLLIDPAIGRVYIYDTKIELEFVNQGVYAPIN